MQKFFYLAASLLFLCAGFTACSDDDDAPNPPHPTVDPVAKQAFVTIQGNQYGGVAGSMDCLNLSSGETLTDLFFATNQQSLGDTPQQAVRYGSHLYVPVFGSNLVWVLNGTTLQIVKQLTITQPEAVCGAEGYVFVAGNDGNLTRIDTLDYSLSAPLAVGPNPAALCTHGGKVWVSVSDGYNYENGYANGKKLAVVDAKQLKLERTVEVGLNPGALCANSRGEVFVVCRGNYYDVLPKVQKVATDGTVTDLCEGNLLAIHKDRLYVMSATTDYNSNACTVSLRAFDTLAGSETAINLAEEDTPGMPNAIDVEPLSGDLYISSDKGPMDYDKQGYVLHLSPEGALKQRFEVGIHPFGVVF